MEVRVITTMAPWCLLCVPGLAGSTASEPGGAMHLPLRLLMLERRCNLKSTVLNTITRGRWIYNHEYSILQHTHTSNTGLFFGNQRLSDLLSTS